MNREQGRKSILTGWLMAMAGVAGYVYTMVGSPEEEGLLQAIRDGGPVAWLSAALIAVGVGFWIAGNIAIQRALRE